MTTTDNNVHRVRATQKKRMNLQTEPTKKATPAPTKPASAAPAKTGESPNKTDFVSSLPRSMAAKLVVEQAVKAGLDITEAYVYKVRSRLAARAGRSHSAPRRHAAPARKVVAPTPAKTAPASASDAVQFRTLVLALGVVRSRQLVDELERKLAALIQG